MCCEVAVADSEPSLSRIFGKLIQAVVGVLLDSPSFLRVSDSSQGVCDAVDVRAYVEPEILQVVGCVDDNSCLLGRKDMSESF